MIWHSSSAHTSPTFTSSSPISSRCILSIKKSSPYLLYLMPVRLRSPFLVSVIIGKSGSVHFGTSFCSGSFQSSSAKDHLSESTSIFSLSVFGRWDVRFQIFVVRREPCNQAKKPALLVYLRYQKRSSLFL